MLTDIAAITACIHGYRRRELNRNARHISGSLGTSRHGMLAAALAYRAAVIGHAGRQYHAQLLTKGGSSVLPGRCRPYYRRDGFF